MYMFLSMCGRLQTLMCHILYTLLVHTFSYVCNKKLQKCADWLHYVCLSMCSNLRTAERIAMTFYIWEFY